jgi:hypothetical protein
MKELIATFFLFFSCCPAFAEVYKYVNGNGRIVYTLDRGYTQQPSNATNRSHVGNFKFIKSKEKTSEDIPLDFEHEKTSYEHGYLKIWGSIKNKNKGQTYDFVKVTFSIFGSQGGQLITREYTYTEPKMISFGEIGYIQEFMIKCRPSQINVIEYKVTGREQ